MEIVDTEFGKVAVEDIDGNIILKIDHVTFKKNKRVESFKKFIMDFKNNGATIELVGLLPEGVATPKTLAVDSIGLVVPEFISSTNDLVMDSSSYVVEEALQGIDESLYKHFAPVRSSSKSGVVHLYLSDEVKSSEQLKDSYRSINTKLSTTPWCSSVKIITASVTVIDYIHALNIKSSIGEDSGSDSDSARAAVALLQSAVEHGSTDIHIHYNSDSPGSVEFRVDKLLSQFSGYSGKDLIKMIRHIFQNICTSPDPMGLSLSSIQSAEGELILMKNGFESSFTLRWQSAPKLGDGLKVVIRLLDNDSSFIMDSDLLDLGYTDQHKTMVERAIATKKGFILTSGTTSSGKSTTNSKIIGDIKKKHRGWSVATVEDPIEYRLDGVTQLIVNSSLISDKDMSASKKSAMAFNSQLISLMRQDPDVVGVGEIRDETTASLILKLVDTGHKAISTIHADSAIYTIDRLVNIGLDRDTLCRPGFFSLINYQLLLPRPCAHCSEEALDSKQVSNGRKDAIRKILGPLAGGVRVASPNGCDKCSSGFKGMSSCCEMIIPDLRLCQFLREKDYVGAIGYWKNDMPPVDAGAVFQGRTAEDHMLWKLAHGEICLLRTEEDFDNTVDISTRNDYYKQPEYKMNMEVGKYEKITA